MFASKHLFHQLHLYSVTACLCLSACTSTLPTAVDVDRKQNLALPSFASDAISKIYNYADRSKYQLQGLLDSPEMVEQNNKVQLIFNRLITYVDAFYPQASQWDWEIHVVDRGVVNAYAVGAGKVMVYRGLIEHLALTEDETAFIVAHEMAHNLRLHAREYFSNYLPVQLASIGLSQALSPWASAMITDYGYEKTMSRVKETEADRIGLELMARAGFNPGAAPQSFVKFYQHESMQRDAMAYEKIIPRSTYLRTHPLSEDREIDMQQQMSKVSDLYALSEKYSEADRPMSSKRQVNLDYIDDYEKLYWVGRIAPQTVLTRLVHANTDVSFGSDLGYGWMLKRTSDGGLNLHLGLTYFHGDSQIKGNFVGGFAEAGWVFNPQWQAYGRVVSAHGMIDDHRRKQKILAGVRWGNFNSGHLYLEAGEGQARFRANGPWKTKNTVELGYALNFGLF